jgi:G:T/U-mismatch repair DNA glycosylase
MENFFALGAIASGLCYIFLRFVPRTTTDVAAQEAAEYNRLEQLVLAQYRNDVWHIVIGSLLPDSNNEFILAEETRRWITASGNPNLKVFVCEFRDIDNYDETWEDYRKIRLPAFRAQVKAEQVAEFKNAPITEGGLSFYQQYVLGKKAPQLASFSPVFLASGMTTNEFMIALIGTIFFCIWGGLKMDKKTRTKQPKQPKHNQKGKPNTQGSPQETLAAANRELAKMGLAVNTTPNGLQLTRKEGQNG